jgi:hypothetical protein
LMVRHLPGGCPDNDVDTFFTQRIIGSTDERRVIRAQSMPSVAVEAIV